MLNKTSLNKVETRGTENSPIKWLNSLIGYIISETPIGLAHTCINVSVVVSAMHQDI
ncbi:hypothetical protein ACU8KH_00928 [Lachancea thermotolerans]